jgi:hypothetical protein
MIPIPLREDEDESERAHREQTAANAARERHQRRLARLEHEEWERTRPEPAAAPKQAAVLAAIERAKAKAAVAAENADRQQPLATRRP